MGTLPLNLEIPSELKNFLCTNLRKKMYIASPLLGEG